MHVTHMEIEWLAHLESTNGRLAQAGVLSPKLLYISRAASYFYDTDCKIFFSGFGSDGSKGKGPCSSVSWNHFHTQLFWINLNFCANSERLLRPCPNVSTTPLRQWGFRQCLPFSWTTLIGKLNILLEGSLMWLEWLKGQGFTVPWNVPIKSISAHSAKAEPRHCAWLFGARSS